MVTRPVQAAVGFRTLATITNRDLRSVKETLQAHEIRNSGSYGTFKAEMELAKTASKMQTYYEWKLKSRTEIKKEDAHRNWNKVSLVKLFTGRS